MAVPLSQLLQASLPHQSASMGKPSRDLYRPPHTQSVCSLVQGFTAQALAATFSCVTSETTLSLSDLVSLICKMGLIIALQA